MRVSKKPFPPNIKHYAVTIWVTDLTTGVTESYHERTPALSITQAIRRAGMRIVQKLVKENKNEALVL